MSCYQKESGSYRLPTAAFAKFRKSLIDAYNARQVTLLQTAEKIFAQMNPKAKGLSEYELRGLFDRLSTQASYYGFQRSLDPTGEIRNALFRYNPSLRRDEFGAPKKSHFALLPARATSIGFDHAVISFEPKTSSVYWGVSENNQAVDTARDHPMAGVFFAALAKVSWTRGSGGYISYTDEYMRDGAEGSFYGAERERDCFGPIGKREQEARTRGVMAYAGFTTRRRRKSSNGRAA